MKPHRLLVSISCICLCCACATVPVTGRRSLALVSNAQLVSLSAESYREVVANAKLSKNPQQIEQVWRVGNRLANATEGYLLEHGYSIAEYDWEYNVIKDNEQANAFAMPGGKIAVYTGIFPFTKTDPGLAVVMSHEIAHALAGHARERYSQALLAQAGSTAVSVAIGDESGVGGQILMQTYGIGVQMGALLPYSRLHETEADVIGLTLMALAGYDPREAVAFWQRMAQANPNRPPKILATHPNPAARIARIQQHLPEAIQTYEANRRGRN